MLLGTDLDHTTERIVMGKVRKTGPDIQPDKLLVQGVIGSTAVEPGQPGHNKIIIFNQIL